jgi:hypothetical protein
MKEAIRSFETSVHTRATWRLIPEEGSLPIRQRENLKSYETRNITELFKGTELKLACRAQNSTKHGATTSIN